MDLYMFDYPFFRDKSRFRYTSDGRILIKSDLTKRLDLEKKQITIIFAKNKIDDSEKLALTKVNGWISVKVKPILPEYLELKEQYAPYALSEDKFLHVYLSF